MRNLIAGFLLFCSVACGQNIYAPSILTSEGTSPVAWSKLGSSTTAEMPMYQTSYAVNHTVTAGTDLLTVSISQYGSNSPTAITFNGDAMTKAIDSFDTYVESFRVQIWYLVSPDAGEHSISMTFGGEISDLVVGASNFENIALSSPVRDTGANTGESTTPSASVDGAQSGDLIYAVVVVNGATLSCVEEDWEEYHDGDNITGGGAKKLATGASETITWTSGNQPWYTVCVAFKLQ